MANITFNTRIQNKIDTYENYDAVKDRFIPLKGEVCIATVSTKVDGVQSTPQTLIKIGDGTSTWGSLKWLSATAADVIASLKGSNPTLPAASITGLNEYISGQIQDTNTLYRLVASGDMGIQLQSKEKGEEDTAFKNVGSPIVLTAPTYSLIPGDTNGTVKFGITGSEAEVKVHGLGSAAYTESSAYAPAGAGVPSTEGVPTDYLLSPAGWVAPPSGGGGAARLVIDDTTTEDAAYLYYNQDSDGIPFDYQHIIAFIEMPTSPDPATTERGFWIRYDDGHVGPDGVQYDYTGACNSNNIRYGRVLNVEIQILELKSKCYVSYAGQIGSANQLYVMNSAGYTSPSKIGEVKFLTNDASLIPSGTRVLIWAVG